MPSDLQPSLGNHSMKSSSLPALLALLAIVSARNNWKKPCLKGECWYDIPSQTPDSFGGSLVITGAPDAISDITAAAGWVILDCDSRASAQKIRIVCANESNTNYCNHLFFNGAKNKIVRLPENCGPSPFARVAGASTSSDQSLPPDIAQKVSKRGDPSPLVHDISLDTDFGAADPNQNGEVSFVLVGANMQGFPVDSTLRSLISIQRNRVTRGESSTFRDQAFNSFNDWKKSGSKSFPILDVDKTFTLFDESISCPLSNGSGLAFSAEIKADLHGKVHVGLGIGVAASGKLVPPKVKEFSLFSNLDAQLDGKFELVGTASATLDSGIITLLEIGIPGFDIPDILAIGPVFKLQGEGKIALGLAAQMSVDLSYSASSTTIYWPPSANHPSTGMINPVSIVPKLFISPLYTAEALAEAHLIPKLEFGISAFGNRFKSTIYVLADTSATTVLDISPGATGVIGGCVNVNAGLDIHGGADADFFGLFDKSTVLPIYQNKFELFKKCFGGRSTKRSGLGPLTESAASKRSDSLICPSGNPPVLVSITDL